MPHTRPAMTGSSPRVRGTAYGAPDVATREGIIPARAGNSYARQIVDSMVGDHPRACGEQSRSMVQRHSLTGSSPRVRGTVPWRTRNLVQYGIIPARAGNRTPCSH